LDLNKVDCKAFKVEDSEENENWKGEVNSTPDRTPASTKPNTAAG
jgi:hypothetical protein